ncbi:MAG TPA: MBL fold metallo-hydrolase [Terriglobales bacterium]|nr:MBL fold metallo-hydrolase [Terriglobales bacterium]
MRKTTARLAVIFLATLSALSAAQTEPLRPEWCRQLPRPQYKSLERMKAADGWFEVYRIRPGVFAIYEPKQFEEVISYLIVGSKRALLFDTGLGVGRISHVARKLTKLPVTVLNSHTHFDHTGGNAEFRDILGMDTAYTRRSAEGGLDPFARDLLAPERLCGQPPKGVRGPVPTRAFHITRFIHDGEQIDLGGRTLEVVATPGHTPDSLCLLDRKNRLLLTGDTFYLGPIYLFTEETDFAAYAKSVERLAALVPSLDGVLTAHNVPKAEPRQLTKLAEAVRMVRSGKAPAKTVEGRREYDFGDFSLLLGSDPARSK